MPPNTARVEGYEDRSRDWVPVGRDVVPTENPALLEELRVSERIVISVMDEDGELHYFTTGFITPSYPWDEVIDDIAARYQLVFK
jgi:hypothetical protein